MITAADLAAAWPWIVDGLIALGAVIALLVFIDSYAVLIRPNCKRLVEKRRQDHLAGVLAMLEPAMAGLWAPEMEKRMAALVLVQRLAQVRRDAGGLSHTLIAFIRHRLARPPDTKGDDGFEDIKLALATLGSRNVRAAQAKAKQGLDLSGVNFRGTSLYGMDFRAFRLAGCVFDRCQMRAAKLVGADLSGASFAGADLRRTDLSGADLSGADLTGADLTEAQVRGARFNSANISGAVLIGTAGLEQEQLDEALGDSDTAVPEEFRFVPMRMQRPRPAGEPPVRAAE